MIMVTKNEKVVECDISTLCHTLSRISPPLPRAEPLPASRHPDPASGPGSGERQQRLIHIELHTQERDVVKYRDFMH